MQFLRQHRFIIEIVENRSKVLYSLHFSESVSSFPMEWGQGSWVEWLGGGRIKTECEKKGEERQLRMIRCGGRRVCRVREGGRLMRYESMTRERREGAATH